MTTWLWRLVPLLLLVDCLPSGPLPAASAAASASLEDHPGVPELVPAAALDGTYHGEWFSAEIPDVDGVPHALTGDLYFRLAVQPSHKAATPPPLRSTVFIEGELIVRNTDARTAVDSMPRDLYLELSGLYSTRSSMMLLYANMPHWNTRPEVVAMLNGNDTLARQASLRMDDSGGHSHNAASANASTEQQHVHDPNEFAKTHRTTRSSSECRTMLFMQVLPLLNAPNARFERDHVLVLAEGSSTDLDVNMHASMRSRNCNLHLHAVVARVRTERYRARASNYCSLSTLITFAQMVFTLKQMQFASSPSRAAKMSLVSVCMQALIDAVLCLFHLATAMVIPSQWASFMVSSMLQFCMFSLLEMRIILFIYKARRPDLFNDVDFEEMRRQLSLLYTRFYAFIFLGVVAVFNLQSSINAIIFLLYSFWVPQIIHNAVYDSNRTLELSYIVGMSMCRLAIPLYFFGDEYNFDNHPTSYTLCFSLVVYMGLQTAVLYGQDVLGPRFFVPSALLPPKYDYWRVGSVSQDDLCAICMMELLDVEADDASADDLMVCPCDHTFHAACLQQWMEHKMECPSCRGALPCI